MESAASNRICGRRLLSLVLLLFVLESSPAYAENDSFYCHGMFDSYRQIDYWAKKYISVLYYEHNSGDSAYLGLTHSVPGGITDEVDRRIVDHFELEISRLIKGNLPFHDTETGWNDRLSEAMNKHKGHENVFDIFLAEEEARRNSLYGPNPGAIFCLVRIARRDFPVLYEMECSIVANKRLLNRNGLTEKQLGYSTPEYVSGEIRNSLTRQLGSLKRTLKSVRTCGR